MCEFGVCCMTGAVLCRAYSPAACRLDGWHSSIWNTARHQQRKLRLGPTSQLCESWQESYSQEESQDLGHGREIGWWEWCDRCDRHNRRRHLHHSLHSLHRTPRRTWLDTTLNEFSPNGFRFYLYSDFPIVSIKFLIFVIKKRGYKMSVKVFFRFFIIYVYKHSIEY